MQAHIMLCDYAQLADGKLNIIGGGWSYTGPKPTPSAVAGFITVPWHETNSGHEFCLSLEDGDGGQVSFGDWPGQFAGRFEVGRPPALHSGSDQQVPFGFNLGPIPLRPGQRYRWRLFVDDETRDEWTAGFAVRPEGASA